MDQNLNVGDGGIDNGHSSSILDPAYRYELYKNYKDIRKSDPDFLPSDFCKNKKINVKIRQKKR